MPSGHELSCRVVVLRDLHKRPQLEAVGIIVEDKGPCIVVERETGGKLKAIRADNGGECQGQFQEYCQSKGIRLEFTVSKTPKLNGLTKRMNQTMMERVQSMLAYAKLLKTF